MKYFLDTEFIESGPRHPIQLISIGLVCEDGREFYAISSEFEAKDANDWVRTNVLPHLDPSQTNAGWCEPISVIASAIDGFVGDDKPELWGYYADYDWVVFCQLFGAMVDLPKRFPMYCRDIKQLCDERGNPKLPEQSSVEHNALNDARWNRQAYQFLAAMPLPETKK